MFSAINVHLLNLDNGGYKAGYDGSYVLLK